MSASPICEVKAEITDRRPGKIKAIVEIVTNAGTITIHGIVAVRSIRGADGGGWYASMPSRPPREGEDGWQPIVRLSKSLAHDVAVAIVEEAARS